MDPSLSADGPDKKQAAEDGPSEAAMSKSLARGKKIEGPQRRQKNSRLLLNAMYATAARTKIPLPVATSTNPIETTLNEPVVPDVVVSPTSPAAGNFPATPAPSTPAEPPTKGPPGGGKKKRKSTLFFELKYLRDIERGRDGGCGYSGCIDDVKHIPTTTREVSLVLVCRVRG